MEAPFASSLETFVMKQDNVGCMDWPFMVRWAVARVHTSHHVSRKLPGLSDGDDGRL